MVILGKTPFGEEVAFPFNIITGEPEIVRTSYGMCHPGVNFPRLAELYMDGRLYLDEMVSAHIPLVKIKDGFDEFEKATSPARSWYSTILV